MASPDVYRKLAASRRSIEDDCCCGLWHGYDLGILKQTVFGFWNEREEPKGKKGLGGNEREATGE